MIGAVDKDGSGNGGRDIRSRDIAEVERRYNTVRGGRIRCKERCSSVKGWKMGGESVHRG